MHAAMNGIVLLGATGLLALQTPQTLSLNTTVSPALQFNGRQMPASGNGILALSTKGRQDLVIVVPPGAHSGSYTLQVRPSTPSKLNIPECWIVDTLKIAPNNGLIIEGYNANGVKTWTPKVLPVKTVVEEMCVGNDVAISTASAAVTVANRTKP